MSQSRVRPSARLEEVIPPGRRYDHWKQLGRSLGQPLPPIIKGETPGIVGAVGAMAMLVLYLIGVPATIAGENWAKANGYYDLWWVQLLGISYVIVWFWCGIPLCFLIGFLIDKIPLVKRVL